MSTLKRHLPAIILLSCLAACGSRQSLIVTTIQLGRALNSDNTVAGFTTVFAPTDSVYLSVLTNGAGSGTFSVRWMYGEGVFERPRKQGASKMARETNF